MASLLWTLGSTSYTSPWPSRGCICKEFACSILASPFAMYVPCRYSVLCTQCIVSKHERFWETTERITTTPPNWGMFSTWNIATVAKGVNHWSIWYTIIHFQCWSPRPLPEVYRSMSYATEKANRQSSGIGWFPTPGRSIQHEHTKIDIAGVMLIGSALVICSMRQDKCGSLSLCMSRDEWNFTLLANNGGNMYVRTVDTSEKEKKRKRTP